MGAWNPGSWVTALNLASLGLLTFGIVSGTRLGLHGTHLAAAALLAAAVAAWVVWAVVRKRVVPAPGSFAALVVMGVAGGVLTAYAPLAIVFVGVASLGATIAWPTEQALVVVVGGDAAMTVAIAVSGHGFGTALGGLAASFAGMMMGAGRRQAVERAQQAAFVAVERDRADIERARAELLADRNHLARELHDVLAHTLAALSVQLEAFATTLDAAPQVGDDVHRQLERMRTLVRDGLDDARSAVQALREDAAPLDEQLAKLCAEHRVALSSDGDPVRLPPPVTLALYRVAQESVTNALKHAPGATVTMRVAFAADGVALEVENGPPASPPTPLGTSGAGHGLQGMDERLALLGGTVVAGPHGNGWRVHADVPLAVAT